MLLEKPFAASLADADRMLAAVKKSGVRLAVNWPLRWYPSHVTTKRLIDEGVIGEVIEVHFYDGNRGPLYHRADKVAVSDEEVRREKPNSWWYSKASGGGSLLDYLGYGATLGTWFMNGEAPIEVTAVVDQPDGLEVDEHSITICRYARGLSKLETRWGDLHRSLDHPAAAQMRFRHRRLGRHDFELRLRPACRAADTRRAGDPPSSRRRIEGAVPQAGRIRAPLQGARSAIRGAARSGALPHRAAHRRHRGAFRSRAAHAGAAAMTRPKRGRPTDHRLTTMRWSPRPPPRSTAPDLPYRPPMPRDRERSDRARRRRRHQRRASRRLRDAMGSTSSPSARAISSAPGRGATPIFRTRASPTISTRCSAIRT